MDETNDAQDDAFAHVPTVSELIDERFTNTRLECLRFYITLRHLQEQRQQYRSENLLLDDDDERIARAEFDCELSNLHDLLINQYLQDAEVLTLARDSIRVYTKTLRGAEDAHVRWWTPRHGHDTARLADLQMVVPGIWIGASETVKPEHEELLGRHRIRHVIHCSSVKADSDDDFLHGARWAMERSASKEGYPIIHTAVSIQDRWKRHSIQIYEPGRMEFIVRRREKTLPDAVNDTGMARICAFLQGLLENQREQHDKQFVDEFDGVLIYCDGGNSTSIAVCVALLMTEYRLPYELALHLVRDARRYIAPSHYLQYQLQQYSEWLEKKTPR